MEEVKGNRRISLTKYLTNEVVLRTALKAKIIKLWKVLNIPKEDQSYFKKHYFGSNKSKESFEALKAQITLLEKYESKTIAVTEAIEKREKCLEELRVFLSKEKLELKEFAVKVPSKLIKLRDATIKVLNRIKKWRKLMWNPQPFIWNSMNYIIKIGRDYEEFLESIMFVRLQIFVADFIFFVPQSSIPAPEVSKDEQIYKHIAHELVPGESEKSLEYFR